MRAIGADCHANGLKLIPCGLVPPPERLAWDASPDDTGLALVGCVRLRPSPVNVGESAACDRGKVHRSKFNGGANPGLRDITETLTIQLDRGSGTKHRGVMVKQIDSVFKYPMHGRA